MSYIGDENVHKLVMVYKTWLVDMWVNCKLVVGNRLGEVFCGKNDVIRRKWLLENASYFEGDNIVCLKMLDGFLMHFMLI